MQARSYPQKIFETFLQFLLYLWRADSARPTQNSKKQKAFAMYKSLQKLFYSSIT